jgi:putative aldouronate transport system permease protein
MCNIYWQQMKESANMPKHVKSRQHWGYYLKENYDLYIFMIPAIIVILIFNYRPLYGLLLAFKDYSVRKGIMGSDWVGLAHFKRFFDSAFSIQIIINTFSLSLYSLVAGFPIPIILALMLNSIPGKRFRKLVQTMTYAPNFISVVVICGMILLFLSPRSGFFNVIIEALGGERVNFMAQPQLFNDIYVWSGVWQNMGFNSIIYFAALSGISPELHEAAIVDGASKFKRILHIDIPGIMPTISILLILNFGSLMAIGFEKAFLLQNDINVMHSEIISTHVYKRGLQNNDISFATAVGLMNTVVNAVLLVTVNKISGKLSGNSLF